MAQTALIGAKIHDGIAMHEGKALVHENGVLVGFVGPDLLSDDCIKTHLDGGVIAPGFVDLQVNGAGGVMFNDDPSVETLETMSRALASVGTLAFLPTLITDTFERSHAAIEAATAAIERGVGGIVGLHLEGPHLSIERKGAHDSALIRPMTDADLNMICKAAEQLPNLMLTIAPENVTLGQVSVLSAAGVIVSLGHTDASYDVCSRYMKEGARCTTHLFNAMSQMGNREPGLVGATLDNEIVSAGLIADGIHVHPASIRTALQAKQGTGQVFLVSDAMATVGSDITKFELNGRVIHRHNGRLTLSDGTLAGADLDFPTALRVMIDDVGVDPARAIAMSTSIPADVLRSSGHWGRLIEGQALRANVLDQDYQFQQSLG
ncbi:MAG: N-acetylglucosamine-6-phosphate deacetylase [Paracoccaceae bacterium]